MEMNFAAQEFDLCPTEEAMSGSSEMNPKAELLIKRNVHRAINSLTPQMKDSLLDCLRTKDVVFSVSGEDVPAKSWFIKYLEILFGWSDLSRRHLADVPKLTIDSDQDTVPEDSGIYDPPPSSTQLGTDDTNSSLDSPWPDSPAKNSPSKHPSTQAQSKQGSPPKEVEDSSNNAVALAAAAVAVLSLAILVLLFYLKARSNRIVPTATDGQRDERPLLALSDISAGMTSTCFSFANINFKLYLVLKMYFYRQSLRFFTEVS